MLLVMLLRKIPVAATSVANRRYRGALKGCVHDARDSILGSVVGAARCILVLGAGSLSTAVWLLLLPAIATARMHVTVVAGCMLAITYDDIMSGGKSGTDGAWIM
jgi:hypothetical protein